MNTLEGRIDMTKRRAEPWRPPVFAPPSAQGFSRLVAVLRRFLDLQAGTVWNDLAAILPNCEGVVLDVGCGAQPYRNLIRPSAKYVGIDTADAKAHFGYEMPDTLYFDGDTWPLENASVDVVLCTETLEHVPNTACFLREMARVLRPGGRLVLTVPFSARYHYIPHDYWRFTPACLEKVLREAQFEAIEVYARGNAVTVACYKVMALILPLLFSTSNSTAVNWLARLAGVALSPILLTLAVTANISIRGAGGTAPSRSSRGEVGGR